MNIASALNLRDTVLQNNTKEATRKLETVNSSTIEDKDAFKHAQLKEVAKGFESIFLNMMFKSMRDTLNKEDDLLHGGFSQEIFEDMLYEKYSEELAATNFSGLSSMIEEQYTKFI